MSAKKMNCSAIDRFIEPVAEFHDASSDLGRNLEQIAVCDSNGTFPIDVSPHHSSGHSTVKALTVFP